MRLEAFGEDPGVLVDSFMSDVASLVAMDYVYHMDDMEKSTGHPAASTAGICIPVGDQAPSRDVVVASFLGTLLKGIRVE